MSIETAFRNALLDPELPPPDALFAWNGSDATRRFNVYRNNVVVSLIEALGNTFDVTRQLVGRRFFRAMAREYVPDHLPDSPVLALYGESFPDFIAQFPPAAGLPWLADVARLEWLRVRACHAADAEPLQPAAIEGLLHRPGGIDQVRAHLHPSLGLVESPYAVVSLWAAHQGQGRISDVRIAEAEQALVLRPALQVEVSALPPGAACFIRQLVAGMTLGEAIADTSSRQPGFDTLQTLDILIARGALTGLRD